jgi:hypothetical protein
MVRWGHGPVGTGQFLGRLKAVTGMIEGPMPDERPTLLSASYSRVPKSSDLSPTGPSKSSDLSPTGPWGTGQFFVHPKAVIGMIEDRRTNVRRTAHVAVGKLQQDTEVI